MNKETEEKNYISPVAFQALRTLRSLSVHQSIAKVAEELELSASEINNHMLQLEKEFNKILYIRKDAEVFLTPEGENLLRTSRKLIDARETLTKEVDLQPNKKNPKTFCVATSYGVGNFWLINYMASFILEYPSYLPSFFMHPSERDLFAQDPDLILWPKINREDFKHEFLFTFHFGFYASRDYLKVYGTPTTLDELESHTLIRYPLTNNNPFEEASNTLFGPLLENKKKQFVEVNSNVAMGAFIKNGMGIGPLSHQHPLRSNENLINILPELVVSQDLYANYKRDLELSHPIIKFVYYLKIKLQEDLRDIETHVEFYQNYIVEKNKKMYDKISTKVKG